MEVDPNWDGLKARAPENDLVYLKEFFPGYRGGVAANGFSELKGRCRSAKSGRRLVVGPA